VKITSCTVGPFQENSYLVVDESTMRAAIVDPGADPDRLIHLVRESRADLDAIWLTHAHLDHVGGVAGLRRVWSVPVYLHPAALPMYERAALQAAAYGLPFEQPEPPDMTFNDGDRLSLGALTFDVLYTPGHAPGHVVLHGNGVLFAGDLLFAGSIGRTDLPMSNPAQMEQSLARVCELGDDTVVYPGHGPSTTIGAERTTNVFLTGVARNIER
jgi:glyoxylase-like metal-dependent hydrolase (beta-lactamase superfamily II)